jgi:hypothetical protein
LLQTSRALGALKLEEMTLFVYFFLLLFYFVQMKLPKKNINIDFSLIFLCFLYKYKKKNSEFILNENLRCTCTLYDSYSIKNSSEYGWVLNVFM